MKRKRLLTGMILLGITWFMSGCGIPQQQYDSVLADLGKTRQEIQTTKDETATSQAKSQELTASLEKSQGEANAVQTRLETAQAKATELTTSLEKVQAELKDTKIKLDSTQKAQTQHTSELAKVRSEKEALEQENNKLKRMNFLKVVLSSERPQAWNPTPKANNTFSTSESVWIYAEFLGIKYVLTGQEFETDLTASTTIRDAGGNTVASKTSPHTSKTSSPAARFYYYTNHNPLKAGTYTIEIALTDNKSGEEITQRVEFQVVP